MDLGEILSLRTELDADIELNALHDPAKTAKALDRIFNGTKLFLEVEMLFKEATMEEIKDASSIK